MNGHAVRFVRLSAADVALAGRAFAMMAAVFEEEPTTLSPDYLARLLGRVDFWAMVAIDDGEVVGCLTAHTLMMTRAEISEVFIYDLAVHADHQRLGIGRGLVAALREAAAQVGIDVVFVPADDEDVHALEFYRAIGAQGSKVTLFVFEPG